MTECHPGKTISAMSPRGTKNLGPSDDLLERGVVYYLGAR